MRSSSHGTPRLRFDKVATRVVARLRASVGKTMPTGVTAVVTITAPIRLPAKTAAALEGRIQVLLTRKSMGRGVNATVHGNRVRVRLLRHTSKRGPKLLGFVHNPETDPRQLFEMARLTVGLKPI